MIDCEFVERLLKATQDHDLYWRFDKDVVSFWINCSDVFCWGTADAEEITKDNIGEYEKAIEDCDKAKDDYGSIYGGMLFCARIRQERPQGAAYPNEPAMWPLFDACGPEKETGLGNPRPHPASKTSSSNQQ